MKRYNPLFCVAVLVVVFLAGMATCGRKRPEKVRIEVRRDTVIVRDTISLPPPPPERVFLFRTDTVYLLDTVGVELPAVVPIERKEYRTPDYFAVIEGFRPELVRLDLFPETKIITHTETQRIKSKPRFGVGIQAGYGFSREGMSPYLGVGVQYNIITF